MGGSFKEADVNDHSSVNLEEKQLINPGTGEHNVDKNYFNSNLLKKIEGKN